jgi:hypothetical protein
MYLAFSATFVEKAVFSPSYVFGNFVKNEVGTDGEKLTSSTNVAGKTGYLPLEN